MILAKHSLIEKHPNLGRFSEIYIATYKLQAALAKRGGTLADHITQATPLEAPGLRLGILGVKARSHSDSDTLARSGDLLDAFYAGMGRAT